VRGRRVVDFASGSGLVGIAAMMAGAQEATCADIDCYAFAAASINAALNRVEVTPLCKNLIGSASGADVLLVGDVFYDRQFAAEMIPWFEVLAERRVDILIGDPGRTYLPKARLERIAEYAVPVTRALEDAEVKRTTVWRFH
jgi:predicted nicotinamide N-methyase